MKEMMGILQFLGKKWLSKEHHFSHRGVNDFDTFLHLFRTQKQFTYCKINHAFWETLADIYMQLGSPVPEKDWPEADKIAGRKSFFSGGFVPELLTSLRSQALKEDPAFYIGLELSAWPNDNRIIGTPFHAERAKMVLDEYLELFSHRSDGLLLKKAVMDGRIREFFDLLAANKLLIVGPSYIASLKDIKSMCHADFFAIHPSEARDKRFQTEEKIARWIEENKASCCTVLLQAGTLAPYWILRLRDRFPKVKWVDGGLAFSIATPEDLLKRPWGKVYRDEISNTHQRLLPNSEFSRTPTTTFVETVFKKTEASFSNSSDAKKPRAIQFVEEKQLDLQRAKYFLESSSKLNRWANRGPLWHTLGASYEHYFKNLVGKKVVPCANGGIALQALAMLEAKKKNRPLRWCVSSFGFANTGRGFFSDSIKIDCDIQGLMSIEALSEIDADSFDGIIVTNPFGLIRDFKAFVEWQKITGKILLIDNAAGISSDIPNIANQSFSLHHTKPFGFGEGGLAVVDDEDFEPFLTLLEYSPLSGDDATYWVNNGKLSDYSCAAHLIRLETATSWLPLYQMQAIRVTQIAKSLGLTPLIGSSVAAMSLPFLASHSIRVDDLRNDILVFGKYYKPLAKRPVSESIYRRIINIPSHPDVARLPRSSIELTLKNALKRAL